MMSVCNIRQWIPLWPQAWLAAAGGIGGRSRGVICVICGQSAGAQLN